MKRIVTLSAFVMMLSMGAIAADQQNSARLGQKPSPDRGVKTCHYYDDDAICDCYGTDEECKAPGSVSGNKKPSKGGDSVIRN